MRVLLLLLPFLLASCAADLRNVREKDQSKEEVLKVEDVRKTRANSIGQNETYYSQKIRCVGERIRALVPPGAREVSISVAPIYDKTGKVYGHNNSTALSDLVVHGITKANFFRIVETPLGYDFSDVRNSFDPTKVDKVGALMLNNNRLPVGVLLPSDYYVSGALVQFDEQSEYPQSTLSVDLNVLKGRRSVTAVSVGLQLRIVDAASGKVLFLPGVGSASVLMTNKLYKVSQNANLFKLAGGDPYGLDYTVDVSDPTQYAIYEIIEKSLFDLLSKFSGYPDGGGC